MYDLWSCKWQWLLNDCYVTRERCKTERLILLQLLVLQSIVAHNSILCCPICIAVFVCAVHWVQIEAVRDIKGSHNIISPVPEFQNFTTMTCFIFINRSIMDSCEIIYKLRWTFCSKLNIEGLVVSMLSGENESCRGMFCIYSICIVLHKPIPDDVW